MTKTETDRKRATINREKVAKIKLEKGCSDCGYDQDSRALEFDHKENTGLPGSGKQRTVASLMYASWKVIVEEMEKCEVVCCNCHAIRTAARRICASDGNGITCQT